MHVIDMRKTTPLNNICYRLYRKTFNVIGFFTENNSACAYYLFTKDGSNSTKEWEPQELDDVTGNYSLIIEWTMEVSNK